MDLIALDMVDYEVILRIIWLSNYHVSVDYVKKILTFKSLEEEEFLFISITKKLGTPVISAMKAKRLLDSGCVGYLASMVQTCLKQYSKPKDVPAV